MPLALAFLPQIDQGDIRPAGQAQRVRGGIGPPPAADFGLTGAMSVRIKGRLNIATGEPHAKFEISYISGGDTPIRLEAYAADGSILQTQYLLADPVHAVLSQEVDEPGGTKALSLFDGGDQGALSRVCILQ